MFIEVFGSNNLTRCALNDISTCGKVIPCHEEPDKPAFPTASRPPFHIVEPRAPVDAKLVREQRATTRVRTRWSSRLRRAGSSAVVNSLEEDDL